MDKNAFELSYFLGATDQYHIARVNITSRYDLSCHSHDYAELLWVEAGSGIHFVNGARVKLEQGDLVMVRPSDSHTFIPDLQGITIINIAFTAQTLEFFHDRYFPKSETYFWSNDKLPYHIKLSEQIAHRIRARAEEAFRLTRSNLQLDSLLLFIFRQLTANERVTNISDLPLWLHSAMGQYNNPDIFKKGTEGFVELCGRNVSYINRTVQTHFNVTLTLLLNEAKMRYAITQLSLTDMPIKGICDNCGFSSIGHFYKVFKSFYGQTPLEYRRINQLIV